jgi:uncharacterized protein YvpB
MKLKIALLALALIFGFVWQSGTTRTFLLRQYLKPLIYKTESEAAAAYASWTKSTKTMITVPFHRQQYSLSCEIAALKMTLDYYDTGVSEDELISKLAFDPTPKDFEKNIWGDPNVGFVGRIDGKMPVTGYGVYEDPIIQVANLYRVTKKISGAELPELLNEIEAGRPVIVWGSINSGYDISWKTPEGKSIKAVTGEHARVAVGWTGDKDNPGHILLIDPVYGQIQLSQAAFLKDWALLGNKAVVVY